MRAHAVVAVVTGLVVALVGAGAAEAAPLPHTSTAQAKDFSEHGLGLEPVAGRHAPAANPRRATVLPTAVDLSPWAMPPGDQGAIGSCTTWAIDYGMLGWYANRADSPARFAPMYVYSQIAVAPGSADGGGSTAYDAYDIGATQGVARLEDYPSGDFDFHHHPSAGETAAALPYRTLAGRPVVLGGGYGSAVRAPIKQELANGHPVALAIPVYTAFDELDDADWTLSAADVPGTQYRGGHMVLAVGYDATGIRIENSWGTEWGQRGFATLAWSFIDGYLLEATTMSGFASALPAVAPGAPTAVAATATASTATIAWGAPERSGGSPVTAYVAARDGDPTTAITLPADARSATFTGLAAGSGHQLRVRAVSAAGQSPDVTVGVALPLPVPAAPGAPTALAAALSADGTSATVTWAAPSDDGGAAVAGYRLENDLPGAAPLELAADARSSTLAGLPRGSTVHVGVRAVNTAGPGAAARLEIAVPAADVAPVRPVEPVVVVAPGAAKGVAVVRTKRTVTLSWRPPASDGGAGIRSYAIGYTAAGPDRAVTVSRGVRSFAFTGLRSGRAYRFFVRAVNDAGRGATTWRSLTLPR